MEALMAWSRDHGVAVAPGLVPAGPRSRAFVAAHDIQGGTTLVSVPQPILLHPHHPEHAFAPQLRFVCAHRFQV